MNGVAGNPTLQFFKTLAEVIQNLFVNRLDFASRRSRHDEGVNAIDYQARPLLTLAHCFLGSLEVFNIRKEEIPGGYRIFRISHGEAANLEPSVNAISAAATVLNLVDRSRFDRLFARLDYLRKVIRMNGIDQGPILQ